MRVKDLNENYPIYSFDNINMNNIQDIIINVMVRYNLLKDIFLKNNITSLLLI